jgi:uncharacterized protein (TIGR02271 family)
MPLDISNLAQYRGAQVVDSSGSKIGKIDEIYLDDVTGNPEWALVNMGLFGSSSNFVPLRDADASGDTVTIPYTKDMVKDAPNMAADGHLSEDEERELYRYYSMDYDAGYDTTTTGTGFDTTEVDTTVAGTAGTAATTGFADTTTTGTTDYVDTGVRDTRPTTDDAMTLSEEQVRLGTQRRESGRARLRKYIVTDQVTETVPVQREEVRIEREPITEANRDAAYSGPDLTEDEVEVTLSEEVPVVDKDVVATERIRLDKENVTEQQRVTTDVRREEVEVDGVDTTTTGYTDTTPVDPDRR